MATDKNTEWVIYVLTCPRTRAVRYVGWTSGTTEARLRHHIRDAVREPHRTYRQRWIMSLVSIGLTPEIKTIETGTGGGWADAERRWIAFYRASGARLANATDGGDGIVGWGTPEQRSEVARKREASMTPEQRSERAKKREAAKTPEQRSAAMRKGKAVMGPERRSEAARKAKASMTAEQRSEGQRKRQAAIPPERRSEIARKRQAAKTPEQRREEARKSVARLTSEERSERARKAQAAKTPEQRSAAVRKGHAVRKNSKTRREDFRGVLNR